MWVVERPLLYVNRRQLRKTRGALPSQDALRFWQLIVQSSKMATPTSVLETPSESQPRRKWLVALLGLVALLIVVLLFAAGWIYVHAYQALPQVDGAIAVPG